MSKREKHFQKIEEFKERYRGEPLDVLKKRFGHLNSMYKEARIALKAIIEEKENSQENFREEKDISN